MENSGMGLIEDYKVECRDKTGNVKWIEVRKNGRVYVLNFDPTEIKSKEK